MRTNKHRILLISYHFPPSAAVGGQRIANFARYLSSFGWEPHVLTIQDKNIERLDADRLRGLDEVQIHKVGVLPTPLWALTAITGRFRRLFIPNRAPVGPERPFVEGRATSGAESIARRMKRYLLSFLVLPDFQNGWIPTATITAFRKVRQHRIDWIVTSCPPYSVHLIGLAVKSLTGRRWVADFRDPWMTADPKALVPMSALSIRIESWLERKVVEKSDLVVFNVDRLRDAYRRRYAHVPERKFIYIPNGISVWGGSSVCCNPVDRYRVFTLSYTGALYVGRSPEPIFQAVSQLIQSGRVKSEEIRIKLVGECRTIEGAPISLVVGKYGLESMVEVSDAVPHAEAVEIIRRSHLALLFAPKLAFQIPAKVYDYFSAGTRILAIADDGATADLIRQTGTGAAFPTEDIGGIASFIFEELTALRPTNGKHSAALLRFDARRLTEELVGHLDRIGVCDGHD
jgi:glycosyltransferase involved in cell wall biosynthesis